MEEQKNSIYKPEIVGDFCRENLAKIFVTGIASLHLKSKIEWFSEQKSSGRKSNDSFRTDWLCLLALACYTFMDEPNSLKTLLLYKQETVCHSRWITTASGYLRLFLFHSHKLCVEDMTKLTQIVSYVVSVYVPSFIMIHFKPKACDRPFLTLFQRDLLLAYQ